MEGIKFFLEKYAKFAPPDDAARSEFVRAVKKILGADIPKEDVSQRNGTLYAKGSPALKSEIFLRRAAILKEMEPFLARKTPQSIR